MGNICNTANTKILKIKERSGVFQGTEDTCGAENVYSHLVKGKPRDP